MLLHQILTNLRILKFNLELPSNFAIALSAGSDSVVLSFILRKLYPQAQITILTVNHHLRNNIQKELEFAENFAKKLHAKFFLLEWLHNVNNSNIQSRARDARYELLTTKCKELSISNLFVGHHQDDYVENYIIRKDRKSSVLGLSPNYINFINDIKILKPMFNLSKDQILAFLNQNKLEFFQDHSNFSDKYKRNRVRKKLLLQNLKPQILKKLKRIENFSRSLSNKLIIFIAKSIKIFNSGFAILNLQQIKNISSELKIQLLIYVITMVSAKKHTPRYRNIQNLMHLLNTDMNVFEIRNIHGIVLEKFEKYIFFYKDYLKIPNQEENFKNFINISQFWDTRFHFHDKNHKSESNFNKNESQKDSFSLQISSLYYFYNRYLKSKDNLYNFIKLFVQEHKLQELNLNRSLCKKILFSLPVIFNLEKSLIIPHINYWVCCKEKSFYTIFKPNFIFRFTHYYW
ncbi:MAG: tRNA lysidine(34) synthetase TilS [Rickettsia sp.]|nr:tRNA lysidine(34) synthetase TilS [Rickettsia sp.]